MLVLQSKEVVLNLERVCNMNRRSFIKNGVVTATTVLTGTAAFSAIENKKNKLPQWKGFNLTDFNTPDPSRQRKFTKEEQLKWMRDWGFNFVRLPIAYPFYLQFDRTKNITPDEIYQINNAAVDRIDNLVQMAHKNNLHVSLNLHRAPGYCINAGFNEPYNLWKDQAAKDAFYFHWNMWAKRY